MVAGAADADRAAGLLGREAEAEQGETQEAVFLDGGPAEGQGQHRRRQEIGRRGQRRIGLAVVAARAAGDAEGQEGQQHGDQEKHHGRLIPSASRR
jgi:hypothetical protein